MSQTTTISCPICNLDTFVILDGKDGELDLVSDCENCSRPINVRATVEGADVNAKNDGCRTPLDWSHKHPELADLLRKHGGKTAKELKADGKYEK